LSLGKLNSLIEKQRLKNIEQNKELLSQLGIDSARTEIAKANPLHRYMRKKERKKKVL
jgi:hypothetical protein